MKIFREKHTFNPDDTSSVIAGCKRNNTKAQYALIRLYFSYVKSIALRYSSDEQDADEIVNDSFMKMFNNLDKFDESKAFKGWLRKIVVNTAIDYFRKSKQHPVHEELNDQPVVNIDQDAIDSLSADEILALVRSLSPAYRMVFSLYVIEGYSHKEIAEMLGIREGTSKSNLQDARRKLQAMILKVRPNLQAVYELKNLPPDEE